MKTAILTALTILSFAAPVKSEPLFASPAANEAMVVVDQLQLDLHELILLYLQHKQISGEQAMAAVNLSNLTREMVVNKCQTTPDTCQDAMKFAIDSYTRISRTLD